MVKTQEVLSEEMINLLQGKTLVTIHLYDQKNKKVISSALSWVFAINEKTIRFALDSKSFILDILTEDPSIVLSFIGLESVFSITGKARIKVKQTEGLTLKLGLVEVEVQDVRDINFYGSKIIQDPKFIKTYNSNLIEKLDREVLDAITNI